MHKDLADFFPHFLDTMMPKFLENYCNGGNVTCSGGPGCLDNSTKEMDEAEFHLKFSLTEARKRLHRCLACVLSASACPVRVFLFCVGALP